MEKIHVIEFTTDGDIAELKKKAGEIISKAYKEDSEEESRCDRFIGRIASLTKLTLNLSEGQEKALSEWAEDMKLKPMRVKRSFFASYSKPFSAIASDIIELALERKELNPDREEARD